MKSPLACHGLESIFKVGEIYDTFFFHLKNFRIYIRECTWVRCPKSWISGPMQG